MKVSVQKSKSISEEKASEIIKAEKEYIERASWDVYENANMNMSYSNFRNFLFDRLIKKPEVLSKYLPEEAVSDHFRGDLHIHKLPDSLFIPYCIGWSFKKILKKGLITPTIVSKPARHVDTAIAHLTNFFFFGSQEYTGAQAASGFDVFLAPFIRKDKTPYNKVKQAIQHMLFNLNYPARAGFQSPFTNITLVLDTSEQFLKEHAVIGGKELPDTLGDYLDEILVINKALLELLIEGDAKGQPFTFPIPTLMITKNFDWNSKRWGEVSDLIFEALARRGSAYLLNGYSTNVESLYSMCLHPEEQLLIKFKNKIELISIRELLEKCSIRKLSKHWYEVADEVYVPALNLQKYKIEWVRMRRIFKIKDNKLVTIRTKDGREFRVTINHPLVIYTPNGFRIKFAGDAKVGDLIPVVKNALNILSKNIVEINDLGKVDEKLAYIIGLFIAEGNYLKLSREKSKKYNANKLINGIYYSGIQFTLNKKERKLISKIKKFFKLRYGKDVIVRRDPRYSNTVYLYVYSHKLATALVKNGIADKSCERKVPWFIWNSPPSVIKAFIKGIMDGDGYKRRMELHINSHSLAKELALLTQLVGMTTTIRLRQHSQVLRFTYTKGSKLRRDSIFNRLPFFIVRRKYGMCYHKGLYSVSVIEKFKVWSEEAKRLFLSDITVLPIEYVKVETLPEEIEFIDIELEKDHLFMHSLGTITHNCCRLTIDVSRLNNNNNLKHQLSGFRLSRDLEEIEEYLIKNRQAFGIWALPDATGSIGVVTLNMPRLAALSKGEWDILEEMLYTKMENARRVLLTWRKRYAVSLRSGLMPISRIYLGHFRNHFNTFGVIGLPEAAANFMRNPKLWFEGSRGEIGEAVKIMKKMVKMVREKAMEYEEIDGYLYNVEEIPGESTSYRLARLDMKYLKEEIEKEEVLIPTDGIAPFYSNSIIPYYANISIPDRARWEGEVQQEFTGGVMMHLFLQESPDPKALKSLVRSIALNTKVVYFSITPTIAICRKCGWQAIGLFEKCPKCGHQVDLWSRIVGYYRPLRSWNVGKRAEFKLRVQYRAFGG